jgi:putative toxin-antitoxin system antitoxin component (TIGR02293 family)
MIAETVEEQLGGTAVLGHEVQDDLDWVDAVEEGLPLGALEAAIAHEVITREESEALVIPRRTLSHRRQRGQPLSVEESDRLLRIARLDARAREVFGNTEKARRWLRKPNRPLRGAIPLELLKTGVGADLVLEELVRIAHGIYI